MTSLFDRATPEIDTETYLINKLENREFTTIISYLTENNNIPIWDYSIEDCKTYLHLISEIRIYNYILSENTKQNELIDTKLYVDFVFFILNYLEKKVRVRSPFCG